MNGEPERTELGRGEVYFEYVGSSQASQDRMWVHLVLFLLTAYTTTLAGMQLALSTKLTLYPEELRSGLDSLWILLDLNSLVLGLPFSVTLLMILGIHEMGHYFASRRWRVRATLPFFIPFPSIIGTLGAVIKIKSRIPNRRALLDIGASGPLAGFVVAVVALAVGLHLSEVVSHSKLSGDVLVFGDSILTAWLGQLIVGDLPEGYDVFIHPIGFAGWLGLFVTVLNLLPIGQFDGGHIIYAIFGGRHELISKGAVIFLGLLWAFGPPYHWLITESIADAWIASRWHGWLLWMFVAMMLGRRHPTPLDPHTELDPLRKWMGYFSLAVFVLCFIPSPIRLGSP